LAEIAQQYLHKGSPVFIEGRLQLDTWEDKQTAQKCYRLRVVGENLQLMGSKDNTGPPTPRGLAAASPMPSTRRAGVPEPDLDVEPPF
jgi:single-strand DNA-binding protein